MGKTIRTSSRRTANTPGEYHSMCPKSGISSRRSESSFNALALCRTWTHPSKWCTHAHNIDNQVSLFQCVPIREHVCVCVCMCVYVRGWGGNAPLQEEEESE
jgi:hypothetical protein